MYVLYKTSSCSGYSNRNDFPVNGLNVGSNCGRPDDRMRINASAPANVINEFKNYVREKLADSIFESDLSKFIKNIEENEQIQSFYDVIHLANEFLDLENQYIWLRAQIDFRPFYESMSRRIHKFRETFASWYKYENEIEYLDAAAQAKISSKIPDQKTIWYLHGYLEEIDKDIDDLREAEKKLFENQQNTDDPVKKVIRELDAMIKTNLVLEKHALAIRAAKQHTFPFALDYLHDFVYEIPSQLLTHDIESLKQKAIQQIKDLKRELILSEVTIQSKDTYLFRDEEFGRFALVPPFFIWKYRENRSKIHQLLRSGMILVQAEIRNGSDKYAIMFRDIGIYLKSENPKIQTELDERLRNFQVTMKMVGNSFYRCGQKLYSFPTDESIEIKYSIESSATGIPASLNSSANAKRDLFLSPYGLWSIQLKNIKSELSLRKFENSPIDIELRGNGGYLDSAEYINSNVCTDKLDEFYTLDSIV